MLAKPQHSRNSGYLYGVEKRGGVITDRQTRRRGYCIQTDKEVGLWYTAESRGQV